MTRKLLLAATLALAGCDGAGPGADGYAFGQPEFERRQVTVLVATYPTVADLRRAGARMGIRTGNRELAAFATISPTQPTCTIHVVDPARLWAPEWLGHELAHCIYGRWHNGNGA